MVKGVQNRRNSRWSLPVYVETTWNLITVPCLFSNETRHPWNVNAAFFFFFFYYVLTNLHVSSLPWIFFERSPLHAYVYFIDIFNFLIRSDSSLFIYFWNVWSFIYYTHRLFEEYRWDSDTYFSIRILKFCDVFECFWK